MYVLLVSYPFSSSPLQNRLPNARRSENSYHSKQCFDFLDMHAPEELTLVSMILIVHSFFR